MRSMKFSTFKDPKFPAAEFYRTLRANMKIISSQKSIKTIVITSACPGEGKTTVTINLGIAMAQSGSRVLVIDGNLRNPSVHKNLSLTNSLGFTNLLSGDLRYIDTISKSEIEDLDVILCGPKPPNPSDLLDLEKMKNLFDSLKNDYSYIFIDTPPVTSVTDAALIASICDGTLIVVASGETEIEHVQKTKEILSGANANIIGVVLNKVKPGRLKKYHNYDTSSSSSGKRGSGKHSLQKRRAAI